MNEQRLNECFKWEMEPTTEAGSSDTTDLIMPCCHHTYTSPVSPTLPDATAAVLRMRPSRTPSGAGEREVKSTGILKESPFSRFYVRRALESP